MLNQFLCACLLGIALAFGAVGEAQTAGGDATRIPGRIVAARLAGTVTVKDSATGAAHPIREGDPVAEHSVVSTADASSVVLVFSNGASVSLGADSSLDIVQFEQDPFTEPVKIADLQKEPHTSVTKLSLARGELVGKVVHLNLDQGSEFTVQTPVGAAGIRGTTFRIIFRSKGNGKAFFSLATSEGEIEFTALNGKKTSVKAGRELNIDNIDMTGTAGGISNGPNGPTASSSSAAQGGMAGPSGNIGATTPIGPVTPVGYAVLNGPSVVGNLAASAAAAVQETVQSIYEADAIVLFQQGNVTVGIEAPVAHPNIPETDTTPSQPATAPPSTTPGAGGP